MKFLHISDLHIGKRVNEFSVLPDQRFALEQILNIVDSEKIDSVLIAGDVYDKSVPSAEAVELFDWFITELCTKKLSVFTVSGNHDSPERIAFGSGIMKESGIFMSPLFDGEISPLTLQHGEEAINVYLLPYIRPSIARKYFPDAEINSYTDAVRTILQSADIDTGKINVLVAHQFVTGAVMSESEDISVGGIDNVDAAVFDNFDYVALGHIHRAQKIGRETLRYSGTPIKYSFSEVNHTKTVTVVDIKSKNDVSVTEIPIIPLHDMRVVKGSYSELTSLENYKNTATDDYLHIILTDRDEVQDAVSRLRIVYPNIMKLTYEDSNKSEDVLLTDIKIEEKSPQEIFSELFALQNGYELDAEQTQLLTKTINEIWEGN